MKGFASALFIAAAATGALAQVGPEVDPSEEFGILTIHSTAINVHLQTWSLSGQQVILTKGANLTMTLDKNGLIWDQNGDVCAVSTKDGSINFLPPSSVTGDYITGPWSSDGSTQAAISLAGYTAYGCDNATASAYQMYCFSGTATPAMPSCTNVMLQPVNGNGIVSTLTTPTASSSTSSASSTIVTSTVTSTSTAPASTTTASKTTSAVPTFTGGASIERVMIAGVAAVAGFAGLMIA